MVPLNDHFEKLIDLAAQEKLLQVAQRSEKLGGKVGETVFAERQQPQVREAFENLLLQVLELSFPQIQRFLSSPVTILQ